MSNSQFEIKIEFIELIQIRGSNLNLKGPNMNDLVDFGQIYTQKV